MNEKVKKSRAIFDIRPPRWGQLVTVKEEVQSGSRSRFDKLTANRFDELIAEIVEEEADPIRSSLIEVLQTHVPDMSKTLYGTNFHEELVAVLDRVADPTLELAGVGAQFFEKKNLKNTQRSQLRIKHNYINEKENTDDFYNKIIEKIREPVTAQVVYTSRITSEYSAQTAIKREHIILPDIREEVVSFYKKPEKLTRDFKPKPFNIVQGKLLNFSMVKTKNGLGKYKWITIVVGLGLVIYGLTLKNELMREGFSALDNLEQAQMSLKNFNFVRAAESFQKSYEDFSQAGQNLNLIGAGLVSAFSDLPGLDKFTAGGAGKLKSTKDFVEAGKLLASSGQAMSEALSVFSKTGAILNPHDNHKTKPIKIISQLKDALELASKNLSKAKAFISDVDETIIPEEKRATFLDFKDKIPLFEKTVSEAVEYADFLETMIGLDKPKKYLFLFQNSSELRPTGGFVGTYGVVSFSGGGLENFFVDDVYNLDGQLKRNIIPPKQLQHITPTWGMRDATWFIDFPASARKAMWFFSQEAGYEVDGVITLNPDIVSRILEIVGSVEMPEYAMALTADNFLASIQEEVEYGPNRVQPKQVVVDFAPRFLEKLYSADSEKWMAIFNILMTGVEKHDILFYFTNKDSQRFIVEKGFGGEIKNPSTSSGQVGDYLTINFSNIKGSKTDAVTDSSVEVDNRFEDGQVIHKVTIKRKHNGGSHEQGFYNRQNPAYVRVLISENAEFGDISGNDTPKLKPLIDYNGLGFEQDNDLERFEAESSFDGTTSIDKYRESDKKAIGFWMITDPGKTKEVVLEYYIPFDSTQGEPYNFYFQKQPGLDWRNFKFILKGLEGRRVLNSLPVLNKIGDLYMFEDELKKDIEIKIKFNK